MTRAFHEPRPGMDSTVSELGFEVWLEKEGGNWTAGLLVILLVLVVLVAKALV